jgi:hypothetical protein
MIRLANPRKLSAAELREWAYDPDPVPPENADANVWDLMIEEWYRQDDLYYEMAADPTCAKRGYLLAVLRYSVWRSYQYAQLVNDTALRSVPRLKGRGRKEKVSRSNKIADMTAAKAAEAVRERARQLIQIARPYTDPDISELVSRLERLLSEPKTITDPYWSVLPGLHPAQDVR